MVKLHADVYQDGADFYHEVAGLIASYPDLVKNDNDMAGAEKARETFAQNYPGYVV